MNHYDFLKFEGRNDWWYEAMTKKNHKKHSSVLKICESVACTILLQDEGGRERRGQLINDVLLQIIMTRKVMSQAALKSPLEVSSQLLT